MQTNRIDPNDPALDMTIRAKLAGGMMEAILMGGYASNLSDMRAEVAAAAVGYADDLIAALNAGATDEQS